MIKNILSKIGKNKYSILGFCVLCIFVLVSGYSAYSSGELKNIVGSADTEFIFSRLFIYGLIIALITKEKNKNIKMFLLKTASVAILFYEIVFVFNLFEWLLGAI